MKKLLNDPLLAVPEMLAGLTAPYPDQLLLENHTVVVHEAALRRDRVAVISGGGSGHEPAHAGYVGQGMLAAAVAGDVFTSPSVDAVLAAIRAVAGAPGALLIVKNYTGDVLNFGLAAEMARGEGVPVELCIVADDASLRDQAGAVGLRGIAGTVLVHKVAGAAAAAGLKLDAVAAEARAAAQAVASMGVGLSSCTVPAAGRPGFELGENEIELGLGIHGERGVRRDTMRPADALVDEMLGVVLDSLAMREGEQVALLVNGLGGTPPMELGVVARRAIGELEARGIVVARAAIGTFLSALEMAGVSLSVMRLDAARLARLDAPGLAPAWPRLSGPASLRRPRVPGASPAARPAPAEPATAAGRTLGAALLAAAGALAAAEAHLTALDQATGDGDLGLSVARGAEAVRRDLPSYPLDDPAATLRNLAETLRRALGGTSGPLYAAMSLRAARTFGHAPERESWAAALQAGTDGIADLGGAAAGDRTMLDALLPAAAALDDAFRNGATSKAALAACAEAAEQGAAATASMPPRRGRSSYLGDRVLGHVDPGAAAVAIWLRALAARL